ncbi:MAG: hypothetical protein RL757_1802 [Bacteroidota bacterium]
MKNIKNMPPPSMRAIFFLFLMVALCASCKKTKRDDKMENGKLVESTETDLRTGNSVQTKYFPSGKKFMETKIAGNKIVAQQIFHEENEAVSEIRPYDAQGFLNGKFKTFFPNGAIFKEGTYVNNELTGEFRTYYVNGKLKESVEMEHDIENGAFVEYHENGQRAVDGTYLDSREHGLLKKYDTSGNLIQEMQCINGACQTIKK